MLRCWGVALFVGIIGLGIMSQLTPEMAPGRRPTELDQTLRVLLPWVVITLLMTIVAGALYRDRAAPGRRLAGILLIPLLVTLIIAVAGSPGDGGWSGPAATVMYLVAGGLGSALGLSLANLMSEKEYFSEYW
jgi:hypothetical protein